MLELKSLHPAMKRIPRTWLRLAFILTTNQMWNMLFVTFSPYLNLTSILYNNHSLIWRKQLFQSAFVQFLFSWQKSIRVFLLSGLIKLLFLNTLFSKPITSPVISNSNLRKFLGSFMVKLWANVLFLFRFREA